MASGDNGKALANPLEDVRWIDPARLTANDWNPNKVFPPELALLKLSLIEDGWTQPIVVGPDYEIVDGFHRWHLASKDAEVAALAGGKVPVVITRRAGHAERMASTIRHNRARGKHGIKPMAEIVRELVDQEGVSAESVAGVLGMEMEEVERLYDRGGMKVRGRGEGYGKAWEPANREE